MKTNLIYQVCPIDNNNEWLLNIKSLLPFLKKFNNELIIVIKTGLEMVSATEVKKQFNMFKNIKFLEMENDTEFGESKSFITALREVKSNDQNECTFYAHTKGVSPKISETELKNVKEWRTRSYLHNLNDFGYIENIMKNHYVIGCFSLHKKFPHMQNVAWHFSGSYFWFRHDIIFANENWHQQMISPYSIECLPALISPKKKAFCIYADNYKGNLYQYTAKDWQKLDKKNLKRKKV